MICKLCQNGSILCDSHIIPEFFYDPLYDNNHRIKRISFDPGINIKRVYEQKGLREKLLCKGCEGILNKYETYACDIWRNKFLNIFNQFNYLTGIDYQKFKLFLISIIWRCGVISNSHFKIDLGIHQEKMREMLLNNNPGNFDEYGCLISAMVNDNDELIDDLIWLETDFRIDGHRCYRMLFGGFIWIFFISSHKPPEIASKAFLQNSGDLLIIKANLSDINFMMKHAEKLFHKFLGVKTMFEKIYKSAVIVIAITIISFFGYNAFKPTEVTAQSRDISNLENQIRNLESKVNNMSSKVDRIDGEVKKASNPIDISISGLPGRINKVESDLQNLKTDVSNVKNDVRNFQNDVRNCQNEVRNLQSKIR